MIATEVVPRPETGSITGDVVTIQPGRAASTEALKQLALTRSAFRRFKELDGASLDPWEATSLTVAEQALERAWLALSQLHADLQRPRRRA